jgi:hypothetical protein
MGTGTVIPMGTPGLTRQNTRTCGMGKGFHG